MTSPACPGCGTAIPETGKCVSCNLPPRHAGSRLTLIVGALLILAGLGFVIFR